MDTASTFKSIQWAQPTDQALEQSDCSPCLGRGHSQGLGSPCHQQLDKHWLRASRQGSDAERVQNHHDSHNIFSQPEMPLLSQLKEKIEIIILWPPGTKLVQAGVSQGSRLAVPKPTPLLVRLGSLAWAPQESRCLKSKGFDLWKKSCHTSFQLSHHSSFSSSSWRKTPPERRWRKPFCTVGTQLV